LTVFARQIINFQGIIHKKKGLNMLTPNNLACEYFTDPVGLDVRQPRLSWKTTAAQRGAGQSAYQIIVAESSAALEAATAGQTPAGVLWNTGKELSAASLQIPYAGAALQPGQRCHWRVRVWDEKDNVSDWSAAAFWEMGLMDSANWQAEWITPDWDEDTSQSQPAPLLRRSFGLKSGIVSARVYVTSLGLYELHLNGQRVGDGELTPGWTSYDHQVQYQTYDVTALVRDGDNALGVMLGDGWYRGFIGFSGQRNLYGDRLALLLQLQVTYADGKMDVISSDGSWRAVRGPILMADIYMGETYDARLEKPGWDTAGYNDADWNGVRLFERSKNAVKAQVGPLIRRHEHIRAVRLLHSPKGETIIDFGQNMVGWVKVRARGPAGTTITVRHAEVLDQQGNFYTENLRSAKEITSFTLKGTPDADEVFEPHFTFQGFQYIAVEGYPGEPDLDHFTGIVLHSDTPATGSFECSNPLINQLQHNIIWGQKGNFVDVPTDCP
jgi:alpha-L-rhamnosidase